MFYASKEFLYKTQNVVQGDPKVFDTFKIHYTIWRARVRFNPFKSAFISILRGKKSFLLK